MIFSYGPDAPELQVRKLGDLAFMFQLYEVAYQAYHNAKRDFSADQAWLHFAGASVCTILILSVSLHLHIFSKLCNFLSEIYNFFFHIANELSVM